MMFDEYIYVCKANFFFEGMELYCDEDDLVIYVYLVLSVHVYF